MLNLQKKFLMNASEKNKNLKIFIQVNIENESQKSGITIDRLNEFYKICTQDLNLNIVGLMCIPPNDGNTEKYFSEMKKLKSTLSINELSMGMSEDYLEAIKDNATYVRVGSKIFGNRT